MAQQKKYLTDIGIAKTILCFPLICWFPTLQYQNRFHGISCSQSVIPIASSRSSAPVTTESWSYHSFDLLILGLCLSFGLNPKTLLCQSPLVKKNSSSSLNFLRQSSSNFFQFEQKWVDYVILLFTPCLIKE